MWYYLPNVIYIIILYILHYFKSFWKESDFLALSGIVAEFNPLHNGHKYLIDCAKSDGNAVAVVISGNFVQRGDTAIIPKFKRAESALISGADMVVELPVPWSMSTAQNFSFGAISQLAALNIDVLYFGSECGDENLLIEIADLLVSDKFNIQLKQRVGSGDTFAKIRQDLVSEILGGEKASLLSNPNDTLAIEYIIAAKRLNLNLKFKAVKRIGALHNDISSSGKYSTATLLREKILSNKIDEIIKFVPDNITNLIMSSPKSDMSKLDTAIIAKLRLLDRKDVESLPDISEGLDNLLIKCISKANSYTELCELVKTKRYTLARIRRIILSAFLGIDNSWFLREPPYVRVLGASKEGLSLIPKNANKPIVTRIAQINRLDNKSKAVYELENKINSVYMLSLDDSEQMPNEAGEKLLLI